MALREVAPSKSSPEKKAPRVARQGVVERLLATREATGEVSRWQAQEAAAALGVHPSSVYRALARGHLGRKPGRPERLTGEEQQLLARCGGNVSAFIREMEKLDPGAASEATYRRRVRQTFSPAELAFLRKGAKAMRAKQLYVPQHVEHRNDVWQMDFKVLPITLRASRGRRETRLVECTIIDCKTRLIVASLCSEGTAPSAAAALATLAKALWLHGTPRLLVTDNGAEFLSDDFLLTGATFGFSVQPARPYAPHQKGRIERFFRTEDQELLSGLPGYYKGPRDHGNKLYRDEPLLLADFLQRRDEWIEHYHGERPHSSLDGQTPLAVWEADGEKVPLRPVEADKLWWLLPADVKPRAVYGYGVRFNNRRYFGPELHNHVDDRLEVRFIPGITSHIWLVKGEKLICIAEDWQRQQPAAIREAVRRRDIEHAAMETLTTGADGDTAATGDADEAASSAAGEALISELLKALRVQEGRGPSESAEEDAENDDKDETAEPPPALVPRKPKQRPKRKVARRERRPQFSHLNQPLPAAKPNPKKRRAA